ncbi:Cylicin-2, partial [Ophiophagus hannah]
ERSSLFPPPNPRPGSLESAAGIKVQVTPNQQKENERVRECGCVLEERRKRGRKEAQGWKKRKRKKEGRRRRQKVEEEGKEKRERKEVGRKRREGGTETEKGREGKKEGRKKEGIKKEKGGKERRKRKKGGRNKGREKKGRNKTKKGKENQEGGRRWKGKEGKRKERKGKEKRKGGIKGRRKKGGKEKKRKEMGRKGAIKRGRNKDRKTGRKKGKEEKGREGKKNQEGGRKEKGRGEKRKRRKEMGRKRGSNKGREEERQKKREGRKEGKEKGRNKGRPASCTTVWGGVFSLPGLWRLSSSLWEGENRLPGLRRLCCGQKQAYFWLSGASRRPIFRPPRALVQALNLPGIQNRPRGDSWEGRGVGGTSQEWDLPVRQTSHKISYRAGNHISPGHTTVVNRESIAKHLSFDHMTVGEHCHGPKPRSCAFNRLSTGDAAMIPSVGEKYKLGNHLVLVSLAKDIPMLFRQLAQLRKGFSGGRITPERKHVVDTTQGDQGTAAEVSLQNEDTCGWPLAFSGGRP